MIDKSAVNFSLNVIMLTSNQYTIVCTVIQSYINELLCVTLLISCWPPCIDKMESKVASTMVWVHVQLKYNYFVGATGLI